MPHAAVHDDYDSADSTDSAGRHRPSFSSPSADFLFPPGLQSGASSSTSTASSTPVPSRSTSPLPQFLISQPSSSCTSDSDSEPSSPLIRGPRHQRWWSISSNNGRRRRKRPASLWRVLKRWARRLVRHPLFPRQPITIILTLLFLSAFATFLTLLIIHILNPDKDPLPWQAYCAAPYPNVPYEYVSSLAHPFPHPDPSQPPPPPFPPPNFDDLTPAGLFIGVFSTDSSLERRMLVRTTWASHARSRNGAGDGDGGAGTSRAIVRFIVGQPRGDWARRIRLEMEMYNDIVILPMAENMNNGKSHAFFAWAALHAWVPPVYAPDAPRAPLSYANETAAAPRLAPHDPPAAHADAAARAPAAWVRPDFVVKADDDSFVMLAELEARLRTELHAPPAPATANATTAVARASAPDADPSARDPLVYWGYLVANRLHRFMAGELYALSWSLVAWAARAPEVRALTRGAEDKQTAKWMRAHPRAPEIRWASERCWIYDHPRSGTVYAHGFLFPAEAARVAAALRRPGAPATPPADAPTPAAWAASSVSTFRVRYVPPVPDLTPAQSVEALVEGSAMSRIREGSAMTAQYAWEHREGRAARYAAQRVGGTVVVHFIKKNMWFLETALALLEGAEYSEAEVFQRDEAARMEREGQVAAQAPAR